MYPPAPNHSTRKRATSIGIGLLVVVLAATAVGVGYLLGRHDPTQNASDGTEQQRHHDGPSSQAATSSEPPVTSTAPRGGTEEADVLWPDAVDPQVFDQVLAVCPDAPSSDACRSTILDLGGSSAAADLYGDTYRFVTAIYPAGPVDVGLTVTVTGGNYSLSPLILGTPSGALDLTDELPSRNLHDPNWGPM